MMEKWGSVQVIAVAGASSKRRVAANRAGRALHVFSYSFPMPRFLADGWVLPSCSVCPDISSQEEASHLFTSCRLTAEDLQILSQVAQLQKSC